MACRRYISGFNELTDVFLAGKILISSNVEPFYSLNLSVSIGSQTTPFTSIHGGKLYNSNGELLINNIVSNPPITVTPQDNGVVSLNLKYDNSLQLSQDGKIGVRERILTPSNIEFDFADPLHFSLDDTDQVGGHVELKYDNDDFKLHDGKLQTVLPTLKGMGGIKIGGITDVDFIDDWFEDSEALEVPKLSAVRLQTSDDFTQVTGKLHIKPKGLGQVPYYTLGGLAADEGLYYNSISNTLSVNRVHLQENMFLSNGDAVSKYYLDNWLKVMYPLQKTGGEISLQVDENSLQVGGLGLALNTAELGGLKITPGVGVGVSVDNATIQIGADGMLNGNYQVMYPLQRTLNEISLQVDENSLQVGGLGLALNTAELGGLKITPGVGVGVSVDNATIQIGADGMLNGNYQVMYPLQRTLNEISLQVDENSLQVGTMGLAARLSVGLQKTPAGITLDLDGGKGILIAANQISTLTDMITLTFNPEGAMQGNYKGDPDGDIKVVGNMISCQISAGKGLQKVGSVISLLPDVEEKLDKVDDIVDNVDELSDRIGNVADNVGNLAKTITPPISAGDLAKTIGISTGVSALSGALTGGLTTGAMGMTAASVGKGILTANMAKAAGASLIAAGAFGLLGGLLGSIFGGKNKGSTTFVVGDKGVSSGLMDNDSDEYLAGWSLLNAYDIDSTLYPDRSKTAAVLGRLAGTSLPYFNSTSPTTGQLAIQGGLGVLQNLYAGGDIYMQTNQKLATENYVLGKNYITAAALDGYATENFVTSKNYITATNANNTYLSVTNANSNFLTKTDATNTYTTTAGTGLTKTGTAFSVNATLSHVTQTGTLANLNVAGVSTFNDLTKNYKTIEGWQATPLVMPAVTLQAANGMTNTQTTSNPVVGFTSTVTFSNLDVNRKLIWGTTTFNGNTYAQLYKGTYTVVISHTGWWLTSISGASSHTLSVAVVRNGAVVSKVTARTVSAPWDSNFAYGDGSSTLNLTVLDGDILVPLLEKSGVGTAWNSNLTITNFNITSGFPNLLNAWDVDATSIRWYPTVKKTNSITSAEDKITIDTPNLYWKTDLIATQPYVSTAIAPYLLQNTASTTYATKTELQSGLSQKAPLLSVTAPLTLGIDGGTIGINLSAYSTSSQIANTYATQTSLATKENALTFNAPLTRNTNTIGIDLSAYSTSSQIASTYATQTSVAAKQNKITVNAPLTISTSDVLSIDLAAYVTTTNLNTTLGNYYLKSATYSQTEVNNLLAGKQSSGSYESPLTFSAPLTRATNTVSIDLSNFYTKTNTYSKAEVDSLLTAKQASGSYESPLTFTQPMSRTTNTISIDLSAYVTSSSLNTTLGSFYTKTQSDNSYYAKASVYTKTETDNILIGTLAPTIIDFGARVSGREPNAGKLGYKLFTQGLDIVGAGTNSPNRLVTIWDNLSVTSSILVGATTIPMGLNTEVNSLLNLDINDQFATKDSTKPGAHFRIDTRYMSTGFPDGAGVYQWYSRQPNANAVLVAALNAYGDFKTLGDIYASNGKLVATQQWVGSGITTSSVTCNGNALVTGNLTSNGAVFSQGAKCLTANDFTDSLVLGSLKLSKTLTFSGTYSDNPAHVVNVNWDNLNASTGGAIQTNGIVVRGPAVFATSNMLRTDGAQYKGFNFANWSMTNPTASSTGNQISVAIFGKLALVAGSEFNVFSDRKVKRDIETYDTAKALNIVRDVRAVDYRYKAMPHVPRIGFIAQEVEEHCPQLISRVHKDENDKEGILSLNQNDLVGVLWAAVKALSKRLEKLEATIKNAKCNCYS